MHAEIPAATHTGITRVLHTLHCGLQLLLGGIQDKMISFDLEKCKETQLIDTGGSCAVLRYHGRYVGCGDTRYC